MLRIAFFEDSMVENFSPIAILRPVFELRCGHFSLRERVLRSLDVAEWGACVRPWMAESYREEHPESHVNDERWLKQGLTLLINGRWLFNPHQIVDADRDSVGVCGETIAWIVLDPDEVAVLDSEDWEEGLARLARRRRPVAVEGEMLSYPWDLVHHNPQRLTEDFFLRRRGPSLQIPQHQVAILGPIEHVQIDPLAEIDPFVVIDARSGPVWIEAGAKVLAFTRLEGPCYIGRDTQLFRALVREGTSIGPVCRVGGEIEESIFQGYSNKYHDGFLGHSYVGSWVNLGALTSNSDLKNDYSAVKVPLSGISVATGSTKVGSFIGDHTKTALCSLMNTGTAVGVMSMLLPGGELLPKHIPSFSRIWHGTLEGLTEEGLNAGLAAARIAMSRRNQELTPAAERLLRHAYQETTTERTRALQRAASLNAPNDPAKTGP
ncbi:MAG: putative sugar nucleotidyl transferase [Planctomycetaceae bacterium]